MKTVNLILLFILPITISCGLLQTVYVEGKIYCDYASPFDKYYIALFDDEAFSRTLLADTTDNFRSETYSIKGSGYEVSTLDPYMEVTCICNRYTFTKKIDLNPYYERNGNIISVDIDCNRT
uniref:Transthyretin-like family protein n=1 Tax=Rhabditophanes sp. KR3021 TaxID=114890 RepID=A0AC35TGZ8_9BILA